MEGTEPKVIANAEGSRTTPSVVAFTDKGEVLVGDPARRQAVTNSENTLSATKRYIGRLFTDHEVQDDIKSVPYKIISKGNDCWFRAQNKEYSPSQIAAFVLTKMKTTAESYLGMGVKNAVITVPAYFNDAQRQSTKNAGQIAGLNVARIINEPTAAALAYGMNKSNQNKTIAVYDLGGGTFDISILEMSQGVFEVKATNGDTHLGGEDFDLILVNFLCDEFKKKFNTDARQDRMALQRIREAAEKAKIELSFSTSTQINLPYLIGANSFQTTLSRAKFEMLVEKLIQKTVEPCKIAIKDSGVTLNEIDDVILVGGMSRVPKVQEIVSNIFGKKPSKGVNPDEAVAIGAAIQGGVLTGSVTDLVLVDVVAMPLGVNTVGGLQVNVIDKNTTIPVVKSKVFTTSADNQDRVEIEVFQGGRLLTADNVKLGSFILTGIPLMPRGVPKIEVMFDLDHNGILNVTATERGSNAIATATLKENPGGLSKEQLEKMAKEAEQHLNDDKKRVELIEIRNRLDAVVFDMERYIESNKENIEQLLQDEAKKLISEAQPLLSHDFSDGDKIKTHASSLDQLFIKIKNDVVQKKALNNQQNASQSTDNSTQSTSDSTQKTDENIKN